MFHPFVFYLFFVVFFVLYSVMMHNMGGEVFVLLVC